MLLTIDRSSSLVGSLGENNSERRTNKIVTPLGCDHRGRVLDVHFFCPVEVMCEATHTLTTALTQSISFSSSVMFPSCTAGRTTRRSQPGDSPALCWVGHGCTRCRGRTVGGSTRRGCSSLRFQCPGLGRVISVKITDNN